MTKSLFRSALYRAAQVGRDGLGNPTTRGANLGPWEIALAEAVRDSDFAGKELAESAIWLGRQCQKLRRVFEARMLAAIPARYIPILTLSNSNRVAVSFEKRHQKRVMEHPTGQQIDTLNHTQIDVAETGQRLNLDDFLTTIGDVAQACLLSSKYFTDGVEEPVDGPRLIRDFFEFKSVENTLAQFWQMVLWDDWIVVSRADEAHIMPRDVDRAKTEEAWKHRYNNRLTTALIQSLEHGRVATRDINRAKAYRRKKVDVEWKKKAGLKVFNIRPRPNEIDGYWATIGQLERTYISLYLDVILPRLGHTLREVVAFWTLLGEIAEARLAIVSRRHQKRPLATQEWALPIRRSEIEGLAKEALGLDKQACSRMIDFFSWTDRSFKGVWGAPLIQFARNEYGCLWSVLKRSHPIREAEIWLEKGGLTDTQSGVSRGEPFERFVREKIGAAIESNPNLSKSGCLAQAVHTTPQVGDIDCAFWLSDRLFLCEIKCFIYPADPVERHNFLKKIASAIDQIKKKADYVLRFRPGIFNGVAYSSVAPLVVTNQPLGPGYDSEHVAIIDFDALLDFLSTNEYYSKASFDRSQGAAFEVGGILYQNDDQASNALKRRARYPPWLTAMKSRINAVKTPFVATGIDCFLVEMFELADG